MALPDKHPEFVMHLAEWVQMSDTFVGERAVKSKRLDYLPATEAMVADGMTTPTSPGWRDYEAYLLRAYFPDVVKDAVKAMIGIMTNKPAVFHLPKRLEGMVHQATIQGEGLQMLLRRIYMAQLVSGRLGLLVDAPTGVDVDKALPYIAFYDALRVINWDQGRLNEGRSQLQLVVIDEGGYRREGFTWKQERKYRVLTRGIPASLESGWETPDPDAEYGVCVKVNDSSMPVAEDFIIPQIGGRTMKDIPFVFINTNDIVPEPDIPPLLGLSNLALAIYRGQADYRQTLYLQGQSTLVIIGPPPGDDSIVPDQLRVGNKGVISVPVGGDAKYIGPEGAGLGEMRQSIKADMDAAGLMGVAFLDVGNARGESGEALRVRVAARTTTISTIAKAGVAGLEQALKYCAEWVGEDPDEVSIEAQTDFADQTVAGPSLLAFMQAKQLGLPLSLSSLHMMLRANDMTKMTFEEENDQIEIEMASGMFGLMPPMSPADDDFLDNPQDPEADPAASGQQTSGGVQPGQAGAPQPGAMPPQQVPVTPHTRGSPVPVKNKVGRKGASNGKGKSK